MAATAIELQPNASLNDADCDARIARAKRALGGRLVIPGHRYQHDEVSRHADFSGDSQKLAKLAAAPHAEYILKTVTDAEPGTHRLVGTELDLVNRIAVPTDVADDARVALQRMLDV